MAKRPLLRAGAFRELFEYCTVPNEQITDFIMEFIHYVFPKNFMSGVSSNKKSLYKKIKQFVAFNRYETFSRVTLLNGF